MKGQYKKFLYLASIILASSFNTGNNNFFAEEYGENAIVQEVAIDNENVEVTAEIINVDKRKLNSLAFNSTDQYIANAKQWGGLLAGLTLATELAKAVIYPKKYTVGSESVSINSFSDAIFYMDNAQDRSEYVKKNLAGPAIYLVGAGALAIYALIRAIKLRSVNVNKVNTINSGLSGFIHSAVWGLFVHQILLNVISVLWPMVFNDDEEDKLGKIYQSIAAVSSVIFAAVAYVRHKNKLNKISTEMDTRLISFSDKEGLELDSVGKAFEVMMLAGGTIYVLSLFYQIKNVWESGKKSSSNPGSKNNIQGIFDGKNQTGLPLQGQNIGGGDQG